MTGWEHALADLEHATRRLAEAPSGDWIALARTLDDRGAAAMRLSAENFLATAAQQRELLVARLKAVTETGAAAALRLREFAAASEAERHQWSHIQNAFGGSASPAPARIDCDG